MISGEAEERAEPRDAGAKCLFIYGRILGGLERSDKNPEAEWETRKERLLKMV